MKTLKVFLSLAVFASSIYVAFRVVPVYFSNYQFQDAIEDEARQDTYAPQKTEDDIRQAVLRKAQSLDIPLTAEQVKVTRGGNGVAISAAYSVHIDLPVHPLDFSFSPATQNSRAY
ncbi:MAG TPA: DUF4845 domain-containing protein [Terriglobales bacterium]|nr:DUF4845 domain-containing protein [Terriglobales bacterium]